MIKNKDIVQEQFFLEESLQKASFELEKIVKTIPEDYRLRAVRHGKGFQYFIRRSGRRDNGEYIKQKNERIAALLAQKEYDEKLIDALRKALKVVREHEGLTVETIFDAVMQQMVPGKQALVKPHYISDECYVRNWKNQKYEGLVFREEGPEFYTRQNLRVRSKSEEIIADILDEMNIPFLYEKPLKLKNRTIYPDFTLLNIKKRKDIFWEHFGMMDDLEYRNNAFLKLREYEECGLYQGDSLIWTFETGKYPLNTKNLRKMIKAFKVRLGY